MPKKIIEFLNSENLHFDLADSDFGYIEFFKLIDTIPFNFGRQKLLRLSRSLGDYSHIYIVWNPKTKKIASYDMEHEVNASFPTEHITRELINDTMPQFIGDIEQIPPTYSAVKVNGDRAYELRRAGEEVKLKPKHIHIDEIEVVDFDVEKMQLSLRVVCGKGTYIRALARDLGRALNSGAYLTALRRTRVGDFTIDRCLDYEHIREWIE